MKPQRSFKKYIPYARRAAKTAYELYRITNKYRNYNRTKLKSEARDIGVTNQYDRSVVYRRKPMPKFKKRKWVKFVRRVNAVNNKGLSTHTLLKNDTMTLSETGSGNQVYGWFHLYGWAGIDLSNEFGGGDIASLVNHDTAVSGPSRKFRFTSAVLDVTMSNSGDYTLEIDVYRFVHTKANANNTMQLDYQNAETGQVLPNPTGTFVNSPILLANRGATPFDFPIFLKKGNQIIKKTKYILSPSQVATFQVRDARDRYVTTAWTYGSGYVWKGATSSFLIIAKPVPGNSVTLTSKLIVGITRNYSYKYCDSGVQDTSVVPV